MFKNCCSIFVVLGSVFLSSVVQAEDNQKPSEAFADTNNQFAVDLYRQIAAEADGGNVFFSPYSISTALMMTMEGAAGETAAEMRRVLQGQQTPDAEAIHAAMMMLNERLIVEDNAARKALREKEKLLRDQLEAAKAITEQLRKKRDFQGMRNAIRVEHRLVAQIKEVSVAIDTHEFKVANALWGEKSYPFEESYLEAIARRYDGGLFPVDFRFAAESQRLKINGWVEDATNNRIRDLLPPDSVDSDTRLVLTNAVYFRGDWSRPFEPTHTQVKPFLAADGTNVNVPLMAERFHKEAAYAAFHHDGSEFATPKSIDRGQSEGLYPDDAGFQMLELPYKGDEISMVLIAPRRRDGLAKIETLLSSQQLKSWRQKLHRRKTHVYLPKFRLETTCDLGSGGSLPSGILPEMGMKKAFTDPSGGKGADFSRITSSPDPQDRLFIGAVLHKAFLEVDEKGTEAAAATAVVMPRATAIAQKVPFVPEFRADRPFLCLIQDRGTGAILFMGRVNNPVP